MSFFTVIITTYNRSQLLPIAVQSVLDQTFQDFELIILDDASTDNTSEAVSSFIDERIRYIRNKKNLHKGGARNVGIENASGSYICFLDDDDYYLAHHLETFKHAISKNPGFEGLMYTMPISQIEEDDALQKRLLPPIGNEHPVAYLFHHEHGVPTPRACVTASVAKALKFNPNIRIGQDTEFFLRIAANYQVLPIEAHTAVQVRHDDNSGALKYNTGKDRLDGYQYIFGNEEVSEHIPRSLKNYMVSYCYRRMSDHYEYIGDRKNTLRSAMKALYYSPIDKDLKIKMAHILYNLPGIGVVLKKTVQSVKK